MSDRESRHRIELDINVGQELEPARPLPDTPFNIAVLGDFSGAAGGRTFQPLLVDRDNLDDVLAASAPALRFRVSADDPGSASEIAIRFTSLEDFQPDRLVLRVPVLAAVWALRKRLADPRTFAEAARELRGEAAPAAPAASARGGSLLEDILAAEPGPELAPMPQQRADELQVFVRGIVAPHLVAGQDPRQAALVAQVDDILANAVRALLHQPSFQALEALWRGIDFLTRRLDTDATLRVHVVNAPRALLASEQGRAEFANFVKAGTRGTPWAVLAGCYTFGPHADDAALLGTIARAARAAGAPFIAAADLRLAGCPALDAFTEPTDWDSPVDPAWDGFRRSADARYTGLALPRMLLRLPYGEEGEPTDLFAFEEISETSTHDEFLWGNPAIACALLLGQSFARAGWDLRPGMDLDIDSLPFHLMDGEMLPVAETWMSDRMATRLIETGFMPLAARKDQPSARLVRFHAFSNPVSALAGGWKT